MIKCKVCKIKVKELDIKSHKKNMCIKCNSKENQLKYLKLQSDVKKLKEEYKNLYEIKLCQEMIKVLDLRFNFILDI